MQQVILDDHWQFKQRDQHSSLSADFAATTGWLSATVPGSVHQDLLAAGQIPDPFYGLNEYKVQWVGQCDWLYRCEFEVSAEQIRVGAATLCCDGLDTVATVWLNGEQVLSSNNMFVPHRTAITHLLREGRNELHLLFASALRYGKACEATYGQRAVWNGDPSRVYVRKAQYHYGWDWGPCLLTAGPCQPVRIEFGATRIADVACPIEVAADLRSASLPVHVVLESQAHRLADHAVRIQLLDPAGTMMVDESIRASAHVEHRITINNPQLWWPHGYGEQPRYQLIVTLQHAEAVLDRREMRLGARRVRLLQEPLEQEAGTTFLFEINNTPIFSGGANWIPADSLPSRVTPETYRTLVQQAVDMHMVMLRVWGGGIYEAECFYDLCDELGVLVWQDFMFACGIYPAHREFQATIQAEATAQIRRLRHHPALVLWCGNNEDYQIAQSFNLYDASFNDDFTASAFPARELYERLLPALCADLDPTRPYWPGSAYGGNDVTDQTVGDRHTWEIWHGAMAPYQDYPKFEGRFVSEFGMEACPALATIESFAPPAERYPQSRTLDHHNKSTDGTRRLAAYLSDNVRVRNTLEDYVYATQFIQAEALGAAYRGWRRRWAGPGRYAVAGALVWQLNDCWPVTSWAIVDYLLQPKPAVYAIRRELAPLAVGLARSTDGTTLWATSSSLQPTEAEIRIQGYNLAGQVQWTETRRGELAPNQTTEFGDLALDPGLIGAAQLLVEGVVVSRASLWPEPFKYLDLPDPQLTITRLDHERLQIEAVYPAKGVWLTADNAVAWSDNMLDVLPGDPQIISAQGLGEQAVQLQWLRSV